MSIFDNILGNWIQIIDEKNDLTIESYKYDTGFLKELLEIIALSVLP